MLASMGMVFVPAIYIFSDLFNRFSINLSANIRIAGVIGLILDCVFFYFIHKSLDKNWSPILEIKNNHELKTTGMYKYIRHPMYLQCWLWVIFQSIVSSNYFVGLFEIISWGILYFSRVGNKEKLMLEEFHDDYKKYMNKTGRIFPNIAFFR